MFWCEFCSLVDTALMNMGIGCIGDVLADTVISM